MRARYLIACGLVMMSAITDAAETVTYTYDAKGRLTKVHHTGGRNDGLTSDYGLDAADNRTSQTVTGARSGVIVIPLGGLRPFSTG